jgi:hypothetical protein
LKIALGSLKSAHAVMSYQSLSPGQVIRPGQSANFFDCARPGPDELQYAEFIK